MNWMNLSRMRQITELYRASHGSDDIKQLLAQLKKMPILPVLCVTNPSAFFTIRSITHPALKKRIYS